MLLMLVVCDNKYNIVEKLFELGVVVIDKDKVGGEIWFICILFVNMIRFF